MVSTVANTPNGPLSYSLGNGLEVNNTYDSLGRPNGQWLCSGSLKSGCTGGTQVYAYTWSTRGSQVQNVGDTVLNQWANYGYDSFNRLTSRTVTSGTAQNFTYSYDRYGNRWSQTATAGSGPQPSYTFNYANNQITTAGYAYDAAGNMTNDANHTYTYDAEGNILAVDGGSNGQYVYDALNRRIRAQTSAATYEYLYDYAGRRTSTWLNPSSGNPGSGTEGRIYWVGQQIAFRAQDGTTYFEHQDYLGTERMRTNYLGQVAWDYVSLPFGDNGTAGDFGGIGAGQDILSFAGLDIDTTASGAQISGHAQFRNYSPIQGRWLAPDPYDGSYDLANPQSLNRYAYVLNNPLSFTDPSGLIMLADPPDPGGEPCDPLECGLPEPGPGSGGGGPGGGGGAPNNGQVPVHGPWTYGNHCGAGGMGADVNGTDAACHVHDDCFDAIHLTADQYTSGNLTPAQAQGAAACNQQLCNSALNVNRDPSVPFSQRWAGAEIILFFSLTGPKGAQCHGF
jgi:RHS repeat-associated protein